MNETLWLIAYFLLASFTIVFGLWLVVPFVSGLPWFPTSYNRVRKALKLAGVRPGEVVYDLGAGDGRVLIVAAGEFGARAVGIEISPVHCLEAWLKARFNRLGRQVSIRLGNFYTADLAEADVVFAYMTSSQAPRLRPYLESHLRPGVRVITISFDFDGWQPSDFDRDNLIFLYRMPPQPGNLSTYLSQQALNGQGLGRHFPEMKL
jgi:SAM-dependent methyltransferase